LVYFSLPIALFCLVFPVYAPEASDNASPPARESKQKSATIAARKQTLSSLLSAAGELRRANDTKKAIQTLNEAGHLQLDLSQPNEALTTFQQSSALLYQDVDPVIKVDTLNGLAAAHNALNQYSQAIPLLNDARTISDQNNYPAGKAEALLLLSECQNNKSHDDALSTAGEALSIWQSIGNQRGIVRSHLALGTYHYAQASLIEAEQNFQTALELARQINDSLLQAESLVYIGFIGYRKCAGR
jgi:tetratricopeptide (TPR) repeat protein